MSKSEKKPLLRVKSDDSGVVITVMDRKFAPIREGAGEVEIRVEPGIYGARFEAGTSVREQLVNVPPDAAVVPVHQGTIAFSAPAPLENTRTENAAQGRAARQLSKAMTRRVGSGGRLMIFVRDLDHRGRTLPTRGLALHGPAGENLDVAADSLSARETGSQAPPWAGCNYGVDPGIWRISAQAPAGVAVEQSLVVCDGWQTQLFLQRGVSRSGGARRPDLANGAVLMYKNRAFDPSGEDLRNAELARQGLRDRRTAIDKNELEHWLAGKPRNPMLAVYGAHLLLRAPRPDKSLIARVAENLRRVIAPSPHPDVRAIDLWLDNHDGEDFAQPPMLKSSWAIIVERSAKIPDLVPRGSLSAAAAETILPGGPWLRWRAPTAAKARSASITGPLAGAIAEVAAALPDDPYEVLAEARIATPVKASVIALAHEAGAQIASVGDAEILAILSVPRTVAEDTLGAVLDELTS